MNNKTKFHRIRKETNFTIIHNEVIQRKDLSWKAKGIMVYVFSLPDDWVINLNEIMTHATDGETSFRSGWNELIKAGYVERKRVRDPETKKIIRWDTYIYEKVDVKGKKPHSEKLDIGKEDVGKEDVGNDKLLSTNSTKDLKNKERVNEKRSRDSTNVKYNDTHLELAKLLWKRVKANMPIAKEPNFDNWADDIRLMFEQDDRTELEVRNAINWSQSNKFWKSNVRSANKLRSQYENLYAQALADNVRFDYDKSKKNKEARKKDDTEFEELQRLLNGE